MGFKNWFIFIFRGLVGIVLTPLLLILVLFILMNMVYKNVVGVFSPKKDKEFFNDEYAE